MKSRIGLFALSISILFVSSNLMYSATKKKEKTNSRLFYKYMEGAFEDGSKIILNLTCDDTSASGNCYIAKEMKTINFFSTSHYDKNGTIVLEEFENYDDEYNPIISGTFTGKIKNDTIFTGVWKNNKTQLEKHFELREIKSPDAAEFQLVNFNKSYTQKKTKSENSAFVSYTYPKMHNNGNTQVQQKINDAITNIILEYENYEGDKIRVPSLEVICNEFIKAYKEYQKEAKSDGNDDIFGWYDLTSINIVYNSSNFISMEHSNTSFTGGAHGNEYLQGLCFNLETGDRIILEDLFNDSYDDVLELIGEQEFRKTTGTADNEPLSERWWFEDNKFHLNNNFVLLSEGIKFNFIPYEIGSYAEGSISFLIPYSKLKSIIRRDGLLKDYLK